MQLTGLGARDSLRLEAGLCVYGSDLDENTTPVEAGLPWVIGKDRRENGTFIGADGVRAHLKNGPPRRRVGMLVEGAPAAITKTQRYRVPASDVVVFLVFSHTLTTLLSCTEEKGPVGMEL